MKLLKKTQDRTQVVMTFHILPLLCCFLFFVPLLFLGCAPQLTTEIQEWGIVGYEDVYSSTQIIDPSGVIIDESRTLAGVKPVYGYYTQEVIIDPETRNSHDVLSKVIGAAVYGTIVYVVIKCLK